MQQPDGFKKPIEKALLYLDSEFNLKVIKLFTPYKCNLFLTFCIVCSTHAINALAILFNEHSAKQIKFGIFLKHEFHFGQPIQIPHAFQQYLFHPKNGKHTEKNIISTLTHFRAIFHLIQYIILYFTILLENIRKAGFLMFSGDIEMQH